MSEFERTGSGLSYLIRLWREPGREKDPKNRSRVYVRNLRSGDERYLKSLDELVEFLARDDEGRLRESAPDAGRRRTG